jgi:hypothetical protein
LIRSNRSWTRTWATIVVKSATGIRNTRVWKKLYKFQRDGVVGAIDKLERFGGCILADSVGLGKTFEALAVIKYYELRNDRVWCWRPSACATTGRSTRPTTGATRSRRPLQLRRPEPHRPVPRRRELRRHRPRPRELGQLRPRRHRRVAQLPQQAEPRDRRDTRYDRLMRRIIKAGVKTKVLMLSATPVNNRLADLKNQIAFVTEGDDALADTASPASRPRSAWPRQFNRWLQLLDPRERTARAPDGHARASTTSSCSTC